MDDSRATPGPAAAAFFWHALQNDTPPPNSGNPIQPAQPANSAPVAAQDIGFLNRLAHTAQTVQRLADTSWWMQPAPAWQCDLRTVPAASVFVRLARSGATGILHVHTTRGDERYLAVAGGQVRAAASPNKNDALGAYLIAHDVVSEDAAARAQAFVAGTDKPMAFSLLSLQLVTPERLFRAQQEQAQSLVSQLVAWTDGEADFYEAQGAVELRRIIDAGTAVLLRDAFVHAYMQDVTTLRRFTAPFFERTDPLVYEPLPDSLLATVDQVDAAIVDCARNNQSPQLLMRAVSGRPAPDFARLLADVYVLNHMGALTFAAEPRHVKLPVLPANFRTPQKPASQAPKADALAVYQEQKDVLALAKRALYAFDPNRAAALLTAFMPKQPTPPAELLAYHALALLLQGNHVRAHEQALRALRVNPQDALAHAAMARVFDASGDQNSAYHRKLALNLAQNNTLWLNEVNAALGLNARPQVEEAPSDARAMYLWLFAIIAGMGVFAMSNIFKMGGREYYYVPETFFFARRAVLLVTGWLGMLVWLRKSPWRAMRDMNVRISSNWVLACVAWGFVVGAMSPVQFVAGAPGIVLALTVLHVLAEEVFFRGFITRMLIDQFDDKKLPLLVSAIIYAVYHLSYQSFWFHMGNQPRSFYCGLIALFAGWPLAWMVRETKGLTAPFLCHLTVNVTMMVHSLVARDGWAGLVERLS